MSNYFINRLKEYIFIILTATIFSVGFFSKTFSSENVFAVDNIEVTGNFNTNFSREKYINKAFLDSFKILMSKILLSEDLVKLNDVKLSQVKVLVNSFKIERETYTSRKYKGNFTIYFDDIKVKKLLVKKNISFSQPKNISAVFFPVFFIDNKLLSYSENYFYNNWSKAEIENQLINYILPIEDLDDFSSLKKIKNNIDEFDIITLVQKYNTKNYVLILMEYQKKKLNIYLKTNFNNNKLSKFISYTLENLNDENKLDKVLKELKLKITDLWKSENIINLAAPLTIRTKFEYENIEELSRLKNIFQKMNIIEKYSLEEFNINESYFKIYYYGSPKRLKIELSELGYHLKNNQGYWGIYKND
tara:strand:- start:21 stop:1103 length:1083 start_codon:yes stop_codon:yes gene_type:complete